MSLGQQLIARFRRLFPIEVISEHTLLLRYLRPDSIVLDLGANHGNFSTTFQKRHGGKFFAVEANPELYQELKEKQFNVIHAAASGKPGAIEFNISVEDDASSIFAIAANKNQKTVKVEALNYANILKKFRLKTCDVLKLDIEGAEVELLESMKDEEIQQISQITIEFHSFMGYYSSKVSDRIVNRIKQLGFYDFRIYKGNDEDVLMVNKNLGLGAWWDLMKTRLVVRPMVSCFWTFFKINQDIVGTKAILNPIE